MRDEKDVGFGMGSIYSICPALLETARMGTEDKQDCSFKHALSFSALAADDVIRVGVVRLTFERAKPNVSMNPKVYFPPMSN